MARSANQIHIIVGHRQPSNKENPYAVFNIEVLQRAMRDLDGGSLKLWLYIQKNQENYEFDLSRVACEAWGLKRDSYRRAKEDLISKGYLVEVAGADETYEFYEVPPEGISKNELEILTAKDF